jgi:predicted GIY-YIG superfamily endonuclease
MSAMWYVFLRRLNNGDIYVGSTDDLRRRIASHRNGQVISTRGNLPATLEAYVAVADEVTARRLERYFKSGSGEAFAKKTLSGEDRITADQFAARFFQARSGRFNSILSSTPAT